MRLTLTWLVLLMLCAARAADDPWAEAQAHGLAARDAFEHSHRFVQGWLAHRDPASGLYPQNLRSPLWTAHNSAADLYPFMVLTAYFTDPGWFDGLVRDVLHDEIRLTTRLRRLPDTFAFATQTFEQPQIDLARIIFGASEYAKDGLLPISEALGRDEWFDRMRGLLEDIIAESPIDSDWGKLPAGDTEVCGEMLQTLCRMHRATSDRQFLEAACRIGDAWFLEVLPAYHGLPVHRWDFTNHRIAADLLSLNDHGNEIVGGLSELLLLTRDEDPERFAKYAPAMRRMLDVLLEHAVNEDGLWVGRIEPSTLKVLAQATPDTWGYALNGVYTTWLASGEERYRAAVERVLHAINQDKYKRWGGADAFADSIEGGLVLYNRIRAPECLAWLGDVVPVFLAKQQPDGVIEGWHGDGNYARTALMWALFNTQGAWLVPWRQDVLIGGATRGDALHLRLEVGEAWSGRVRFDRPRHRDVMGLPINYPRLNEYPEWYTLESTKLYDLQVGDQRRLVAGGELIRGLALELAAGQVLPLTVRPVPGPPYGTSPVSLLGRRTIATSDGRVDYRCELANLADGPSIIHLTSDWGEISPAEVSLEPEARAAVLLRGQVAETTVCTITAIAADGRQTRLPLRIVREPRLLDLVECCGTQSYAGECYLWTGDGPIQGEVTVRPGAAQVLWLRWGAKDDQRAARLELGGRESEPASGGYDGFRWLAVPIPAELATGPRLTYRLTGIDGRRGAFVSEIRVMEPGAEPAER